MEKFFNTAGPVREDSNYMIDPLKRINKDEIMMLIEQKKYFVLHAPRQTGKTSSLLALQNYINNEGKYKCLYINIETAQTARSDVARGMKAILSALNRASFLTFKDDFFEEYLIDGIDRFGGDDVLNQVLSLWSLHSEKKVILLIDEIDALIGDTLISILRQLRAGYTGRPDTFPQSIILCGVRDVRDYRIFSDKDQQIITGGSAFNIKATSLTVGDFSRQDIKTLYEEHTKETGQEFEKDVYNLAWEYTTGQPWLVNALAYETCFEDKVGRDRSKTITTHMYEAAKRNLILRRDTHIDQLADKLKEDRVRRVIEPMLEGEEFSENVFNTDIEYCKDLGLIKKTEDGYQIANAIYREIIPRELGYMTQLSLESKFKRKWYVNDDGTLNMEKLLTTFQQFFREHSESWLGRFQYEEAGPQLLLQAFLQRIINGGGQIDREYGLGKKRTDLYIRWPIIPDRFKNKNNDIPFPTFYNIDDLQRIVIEIKLKHKNSLEKVIEDGLEQTVKYVDKTGAKDAYLIIFDQENDNWEERIFTRTEHFGQREIVVYGM
jgi:hypothetical protein